MQQINEKSHYSTLISSLNKEYKKTKLGKSLTPNDIYLLDVVYNLLQGCCLELSDIEIKKLLNIYNNILFTSKVICNNNYQEVYQMTKEDKFIQAEKIDCNNIPVQPAITKIYYWQEPLGVTSTTIISNIATGIYLNNKPSVVEALFSDGKDINYTNIGLICFALDNTLIGTNYAIYDDNDANVTDSFQSFYNVNLQTRTFISYNIYSHGIMNFKIKKI